MGAKTAIKMAAQSMQAPTNAIPFLRNARKKEEKSEEEAVVMVS
jgi:hypothetical protein